MPVIFPSPPASCGLTMACRARRSADAPFLDSAHKLVTYAGRPVMKLSPEKAVTSVARSQWSLSESSVTNARDFRQRAR